MTPRERRDAVVAVVSGVVAIFVAAAAVLLALAACRLAWRSLRGPVFVVEECRDACPYGWAVVGNTCTCEERWR